MITLWKNSDPSTSHRIMLLQGHGVVVEYPGLASPVQSDFDTDEDALEFMVRRSVELLDKGYKMYGIN